MTDRNRLALIGIGLVVVLFVAVNVLAQTTLQADRLDLTEDRLFTLSDGTKATLEAIEEPIDLRLYYSSTLDEAGPYFATYADRVEELLGEYERLSGGMVRVERLDPEPFSTEEDLAVAEGLQGLPLTNDGAQAYFGLSGRNSTDDLQVIPYLAPERADFLEYDLTRLIHDLAEPEKPVIAVLGDLPLMGDQFNQYQPWAVLESMYQFFDVRFLGGAPDAIDDDVQVLLLAQPQTVSDATLYAIDQFVMRGGRVVALLDPYAEVLANPQNPMAAAQGNAIDAMAPLLEAWGVSLPQDQVVGDAVTAQRVTAPIRGQNTVIQYLPWLALDRDRLSADDVVTADLDRITVASAGWIEGREGAATTIEPLITSSPEAMAIDVAAIEAMPDPAKLIADFAPRGEPFVLAARVTGPVRSAFPDGPPAATEADEAGQGAPAATGPGDAGDTEGAGAAGHLSEAEAPLSLILIADADLLADRNWLRRQNLLGQDFVVPVANNGDLIVNALDNLVGSEGLISLRGRGLSVRPFEVVQAMEQQAELRYRAKEEELLAEIDSTEAKIRELRQEEQQQGVILTAEQQAAIDDFRAQMLALRQELRDVQRSLRQDVETLSFWVKVVNIWAVPAVIALVALVIAIVRWVRRARFSPEPA